jgi:flagellar biosynthesis regulator FlaF
MAETFTSRHRGPFLFQLTRAKPPTSKAKLLVEIETLTGTVLGEDCADEAKALLTDPRDSILSVSVWSVPEQQHVHTYRREEYEPHCGPAVSRS